MTKSRGIRNRKRIPPTRCEVCGERIFNPVRREDGSIICEDCFGDAPRPKFHVKDAGWIHDREYHGGQFHEGDW